MKIAFLGAAGTVTGSKYLVTTDRARLLVDCGLFQGLKTLRERNWEPPPVGPHDLDAVVLTHAHLDHSGYLPLLVRHGFRRRVRCTHGTAALARILLADAAHLQEEDARRANRYHYSLGRVLQTLGSSMLAARLTEDTPLTGIPLRGRRKPAAAFPGVARPALDGRPQRPRVLVAGVRRGGTSRPPPDTLGPRSGGSSASGSVWVFFHQSVSHGSARRAATGRIAGCLWVGGRRSDMRILANIVARATRESTRIPICSDLPRPRPGAGGRRWFD